MKKWTSFLVSEQSSLTLISFTAKAILNQFLVTHPYLTNSSLVKAVLELFCIFSLSFCKNLYFELASVIIHTVVRKKAGSFQLTTGGNHIMKTLDSHAWSRSWRLLPAVSIHILLNFFGHIVQGSIGSLNVEKSTLGSEFRLSYRFFTNNQPITPVLCSSFKHLQPQLKNDPYIIGGLQQHKGGTATCPRESPSKSRYFKELFF